MDRWAQPLPWVGAIIYSMPIRIKRWNDPIEPSDGWRVLICRYRPRGLRKENETWHTWIKELAPSRELHAAAYGKKDLPITRSEYNTRFFQEMEAESAQQWIRFLRKVALENNVTLLCSSACVDEERCHRSLLKKLIMGDY